MLLNARPAVLLLALGFSRTAFAESPAEVCIAANETAQRDLQRQALRSARSSVAACLASSCPSPIREDCARMAQEIDAALPGLVVEVQDTRGRPVTNATLLLDGNAVPAGQGTTAISLDPGAHTLSVDAPGFAGENVEFSVVRGEKAHRERVSLRPKDLRPTWRGLGLAAGGAGALMLAAGAYYGIQAKLTYDEAHDEHCEGAQSCDAKGVRGGKDAHADARTATVAMILGGAFLAGGAYLYFTNTGSDVAVGSSIGPRSVALDVRARW
jgi:hypothetical protein